MRTEVGNPRAEHTDVAAYALGLLEEDDRRAFEEHLAGCARCTAEFGDFAGMADLFDGVQPVEPPEDEVEPGPIADLLRHRRAAERTRRRGVALLGAAAGIVLLAGGALTGALAAGDDPGHSRIAGMPSHSMSADEVFRVGEKVAAADARTGVTGMVALQAKGWGTDVGLRLGGMKGPLVCTLVAVAKDGTRHTVTEWRVSSQPSSIEIHGGTAVPRAGIARFEVRAEGSDRPLLNIPV